MTVKDYIASLVLAMNKEFREEQNERMDMAYLGRLYSIISLHATKYKLPILEREEEKK